MNKHQNKVEKLIEELCPNGVEFAELNEIARIRHGKDYKKLGDGDIPVYGSGGIMTYVDTCSYNKPTVLIPRKGTIKNLFYVEAPFWNVDTIYYTEISTDKIIPKYFYYYLKTVDLESFDTGSGRPSLTIQILNRIKIPLPPLKIQEEIANILDKFTQLEAELEAELEARQKQYEYYKDELFNTEQNSNNNKVPISSLLLEKGYIRGPFGSSLKKADMTDVGIPVYEQQHAIYDQREFRYFVSEEKAIKLNRFKVKQNDLIISCSGTVGKISIIKDTDKEGIINQALLILRLDSTRVLSQYMKYYLESTKGHKSIISNTNKSAQINIAKRQDIEKIMIPLPTMVEQERIISTLDKFDALVNDIFIGLPAELDARRKQYEYYRDKLLTFKEYEN